MLFLKNIIQQLDCYEIGVSKISVTGPERPRHLGIYGDPAINIFLDTFDSVSIKMVKIKNENELCSRRVLKSYGTEDKILLFFLNGMETKELNIENKYSIIDCIRTFSTQADGGGECFHFSFELIHFSRAPDLL